MSSLVTQPTRIDVVERDYIFAAAAFLITAAIGAVIQMVLQVRFIAPLGGIAAFYVLALFLHRRDHLVVTPVRVELTTGSKLPGGRWTERGFPTADLAGCDVRTREVPVKRRGLRRSRQTVTVHELVLTPVDGQPITIGAGGGDKWRDAAARIVQMRDQAATGGDTPAR